MLTDQFDDSSYHFDVLHSLQLCHRRWKYMHEEKSDAVGCCNVLRFLQQQNEFVLRTLNVFDTPTDEHTNCHHHVIFIGKRTNLSKCMVHGSQLIGIDATFNVTCYRTYSLYAIMGRCDSGAYPLGYFVSSSKCKEAVRDGLILFKESATEVLKSMQLISPDASYSPVAICIDTDDAENWAIKRVFPASIIILCHYHFMTSMVNEVRAGRHGLSEEGILELMTTIRMLANSKTVSMFRKHLDDMKGLSPSFFTYFDVNYLNDRWISSFSEVVRCNLSPSLQRLCRSNMLTEVSFRTLKYIVFDGYVNKRLDYLLYSIAYKLYPYFELRTTTLRQNIKPRFLLSVDVREMGTYLYK